jgi:hypothetical protein
LLSGLRVIIGAIQAHAKLLGIPLLILAGAFLLSLLGGIGHRMAIGRGPVFVPPATPSLFSVVLRAEGQELLALEGPGDEYPALHRFGEAARDVRSTGRGAVNQGTLWLEVETPNGDGWVDSRYLSSQVPPGEFASDDRAIALVEMLSRYIADRNDISPLVSNKGLYVSYFASPRCFDRDQLVELLSDSTVWGFWDSTGRTHSVRGDFATTVAQPLSLAIQAHPGRPNTEAQVPLPAEYANFHHLTYGDPSTPGRDTWRLFFDYQDGAPLLVAVWREGVANPNSLLKAS